MLDDAHHAHDAHEVRDAHDRGAAPGARGSDTVLDRFRVKAPLARGGMGELYLASHIDDPYAQVVLKTIREDLVDDDEVTTAFMREIEVLSRLDHDHIVRHVAHGRWGTRDVLALEHIPGVSVFEARRARFPVGAALCVASDVASALAYLHYLVEDDGAPLELVHGDVSPQNIQLDVDGNAHLLDFGAVRMHGDVDQDIIGKPGYLSPEQSRGDRIDALSDQYSLGIVLWEMITGRDLFEGCARRKGIDIPPLSMFVNTPDVIEALVARLLAFDPSDRFTSMAAAGRAIDAILADGAALWTNASRDWLASTAMRPRRARDVRNAWRSSATRKLPHAEHHAAAM